MPRYSARAQGCVEFRLGSISLHTKDSIGCKPDQLCIAFVHPKRFHQRAAKLHSHCTGWPLRDHDKH